MPQFYTSPENLKDGSFTLTGDEAHHLSKVHRAKAGDVIQVFDGKGRRFKARIEDLEGKTVTGELLDAIPEVAPRFRLTLHIAPLPRTKWEDVLEKGTELGVSAFQLVTTPRDVVKPGEGTGKAERAGGILLAASKQCLRARLPDLLPPMKIEEAFSNCPKGTGFLAWEEDGGAALKGLPPAGSELHVFIGPVGGFPPELIESAKAAGIAVFGLGDTVLRADTAALAAVSLLLLGR